MVRSHYSADRRGFTLVELLVVITIIGILVGLLLPAVFHAIRKARIAAIAMEVTQLSQAIENYRAKRNDYPPDFTNEAAVSAHFLKAYPRSQFAVVAWLRNTNLQPSPTTLDPAEALVFWLKTIHVDPLNPIMGSGAQVDFYEFDPARLVDLDNDGWPEYLPKYVRQAPYVYFDGRVQTTPQGVSTSAYFYGVYPTEWSPYPPTSPNGARPQLLARAGNAPTGALGPVGLVRPYRSLTLVTSAASDSTFPNAAPNPTTWVNVGKFQLICPGMDNEFGIDNIDPSGPTLVFKQFPKPNYYLQTGVDNRPDQDNLANFSEAKTFEDSVP